MAEKMTPQILSAIREVEGALVRGDFAAVASPARESRLSADDIGNALHEYGGSVTPAPDAFLMGIPVIRISRTSPPEWAVDVDLWIDQKHSDLTLSLTIRPDANGSVIALVDDLHVL